MSMIDSVVPVGATAHQAGVELGVTWLILGEDWMILDYATRGVGGHAHASLAGNRGRAYAPMGGSASGDHTDVVRGDALFGEALDPDATELAVSLVEARENGRILLETTVPVPQRVSATAIRASGGPGAPPTKPTPGTCLECGAPSGHSPCEACRRDVLTIAAHRSRRLVPEVIVPIPAGTDLVPGMRHAVAGLLLWEEMFTFRFVFEPTRRPAPGLRAQLPGPVRGRWVAEDAGGHTFRGRPRSWGLCESEGRVLGDAAVEFIPALDLTAGPLLVRTESAGRVLTEVELPLDGPTQVVDPP